jgi:crotonobetainyl-CoA:carnitine CoA-transferase CaiB-like acyl-CoA transferase
MILAVGNDSQYAKFCDVAGRPELAADARFAKNQDRVRNRAALVPVLEALMKTRTKAEWLGQLEAAKVPCGAINNLSEVFTDAQVQERRMVTHWEHPLQEDLRLVSSPMKLSATPVRGPESGGLPPPLLGQHTEEILRGLLHYTDAQLSELRKSEVI